MLNQFIVDVLQINKNLTIFDISYVIKQKHKYLTTVFVYFAPFFSQKRHKLFDSLKV